MSGAARPDRPLHRSKQEHRIYSLKSLTIVAAAAVGAFLAPAARAFDRDAVQKEVDAMNQSLPAMVSPVLRQERIDFTGKALMYRFTHVGRTPADLAQ